MISAAGGGHATPLDVKHLVIEAVDAAAVTAAVCGGDLSGNAAVVGVYEQALAGYFGCRCAIACSSGTAAIHLALLALGVSADEEVIVPAAAPVMTALPVLAVGARPVFVDVADARAFALDLNDVEAKITSRTRAVISVPMWGYPADGLELVEACQRWGLPLVEDAAQAHGTAVDGRPVGTQGAIGTFSTHVRKLVCTGEGGFCLTDDARLAARLGQLRNLGQPAGGGFGAAFGLNYKLAGLCAALGVTQLARLDGRLAARRRVAGRLADQLSAVEGITPFPMRERGQANGYALLATAVPAAARELGRRLEAAGVISDTRRYDYRPLYQMPVFRGSGGGPCPNTERLCSTLLALPCHEGVTGADQQRIVEVCREAMGS